MCLKIHGHYLVCMWSFVAADVCEYSVLKGSESLVISVIPYIVLFYFS